MTSRFASRSSPVHEAIGGSFDGRLDDAQVELLIVNSDFEDRWEVKSTMICKTADHVARWYCRRPGHKHGLPRLVGTEP